MPRCEYMDMVDDGDCEIQVMAKRKRRLRHGATIDSTRFDPEKLAMAVMEEGKRIRSGLRPPYRLDPEISRRDSRNAELLTQALSRLLIQAKAQLREDGKKKKDEDGKKPCRLTAGEAEAERLRR